MRFRASSNNINANSIFILTTHDAESEPMYCEFGYNFLPSIIHKNDISHYYYLSRLLSYLYHFDTY